jgi:hypothetical protein
MFIIFLAPVGSYIVLLVAVVVIATTLVVAVFIVVVAFFAVGGLLSHGVSGIARLSLNLCWSTSLWWWWSLLQRYSLWMLQLCWSTLPWYHRCRRALVVVPLLVLVREGGLGPWYVLLLNLMTLFLVISNWKLFLVLALLFSYT